MKQVLFIVGIAFYLFGPSPAICQRGYADEDPIDQVAYLIEEAKKQPDSCWLKSLEGFLIAEQIAKRNLQHKNLLIIYRELQDLHYQKTLNYGESLFYALEGLSVSKTDKDTLNIFHFNRKAGLIYAKIESYGKSEAYFLEAKRINETYGDKIMDIILDMDLAGSYYQEKLYNQQIEALLGIIKNLKELDGSESYENYNLLLTINYVNLSYAHLMLDNYSESFRYVNIAHDIVNREGDDYYKVTIMSLLSQFHSQKEEWTKSVHYGDSAFAYNFSDKYHSALDENFYVSYCKSLSVLGRHQEAFVRMEQYAVAIDSLFKSNQKIKFQNIFIKLHIIIMKNFYPCLIILTLLVFHYGK